jgi:hypothetical protein
VLEFIANKAEDLNKNNKPLITLIRYSIFILMAGIDVIIAFFYLGKKKHEELKWAFLGIGFAGGVFLKIWLRLVNNRIKGRFCCNPDKFCSLLNFLRLIDTGWSLGFLAMTATAGEIKTPFQKLILTYSIIMLILSLVWDK